MSNPVIAISLVSLVLIIAEAIIFFRVMHTAEENFAYKYSDMKSSRDTTRIYCDQHASQISALKIWGEQNNIKPPPEYLVVKNCTVLTPDELRKQEK